VDLDADAIKHCQVGYGAVHREASCNEIGNFMQSELRIPTSVRVVVRPSKNAHYDEVGRLLQSLQSAGYTVEFPSH